MALGGIFERSCGGKVASPGYASVCEVKKPGSPPGLGQERVGGDLGQYGPGGGGIQSKRCARAFRQVVAGDRWVSMGEVFPVGE